MTLQQGNDTDVRGNASVTAMLRHTPSVSCAPRRECLSQSKRYTTRFLCQKVERMTGATSSLCASRATHGYTQREVTDGTDEGVIRMNKSEHPFVISTRIDFYPQMVNSSSKGVGAVRIVTGATTGQRCRPFVCTFCVFERGIKHPIVIFYMRS